MQIVRDDKKLNRLVTLTKTVNIVGLGILGLGMVLSYMNMTEWFWVQWLALLLGILCWQVGLNLGYRYTRKPRPDVSLDENLKAATQKSTLYHYVLPARHVLLTRSGPILFLPYVQSGKIAVTGNDGDKWRWQASLWKRIVGIEPRLGNPTREAEQEVARLMSFINENAPEMDELPVGAIIVFTNPLAKLHLDDSRIPAMYVGDLKKFVRKKTGRALPTEQYQQLKTMFDAEAAAKGIDLA